MTSRTGRRIARDRRYHLRLATASESQAEKARHARRAQECLEQLRANGACEDCGAALELEVSRKRGVGGTCWAKRQARVAAGAQ